jgi:acyl-CoA dehydrogenase
MTLLDERTGQDGRLLAKRLADLAEVAGQHASRTDRESSFPVEALAAMRSSGLLGLNVPASHGGLGGTIGDVADAGIAVGRADMSAAMILVMHCQQVAAIDAFGAPALRTALLPQIAEGQLYLGSVTTEAGTGGHLLTSESRLGQHDGQLEIDRFAPVVTGGMYADGYLVTMLAPDARGPHEVSLVYAARRQVDVAQAGGWSALGMRASHSVPLKLAGTVPASQLLGRPGGFRDIATQVFAPMAHIGWSAAWLGAAAGALSRVTGLLRNSDTRRGFDLDSELLLSRLAQARTRLEAVNGLLRHTIAVVEHSTDVSGPRTQILLNALKTTASRECYAAVEELIDAVGMRHGYLANSPTRLEQALRDLRSAPLNYSNDRLLLASGKLGLLDAEVRFA